VQKGVGDGGRFVAMTTQQTKQEETTPDVKKNRHEEGMGDGGEKNRGGKG